MLLLFYILLSYDGKVIFKHIKNTNMQTADKIKILMVDDERSIRDVLNRALTEAGNSVFCVADGAQALDTLKAHPDFDLVISDIRMPGIDGVTLLKEIKKVRQVPIILITGFAEIAETLDAHALGADAFIAKPFTKTDLFDAIGSCMARKASATGPNQIDRDFCKLSIDDFISGSHMKYDIFIQLSPEKVVKIAHHGEDIPLTQIRNYKSKNIRHLLMRREDFAQYVGFNLAVAKAAQASTTLAMTKKLNILKHTGELIMEQLHLEGVDNTAFDNARAFVETAVGVVTDDTKILDLLEVLRTHSNAVYAHCIGSALYSVMIARRLEWHSSTTLFKLSLGGILHDVGHKEMEPALLAKARRELTAQEVRLLESHCARGVGILSSIPSIPMEALMIVQQHHETDSGSGYPGRLRRAQIYPLARLLAIANEFCDLTLPNCHDSPRMSPRQALVKMAALHNRQLDAVFFGALKGLFDEQQGEGRA